MDQNTPVKRRWSSYKVREAVYKQTLGEFARYEFTDKSLIGNNVPDTLLWGYIYAKIQ